MLEHDCLQPELKQELVCQLKKLEKGTERKLIQMHLRDHYEACDVHDEIYIQFQNKIAKGLIRINNEDGQESQFYKCSKDPNSGEQVFILIQSLGAYLRKWILNYLKRLSKLKKSSIELSNCEIKNQKLGIKPPPPSPLQQLIEEEDFSNLHSKLNQLNKLDKRILELLFFDNMSYEEISLQLVEENFKLYTIEALRKRKERALERLRFLFLK